MKIEDKIYKIRRLTNKYHPDSNKNYVVYGVTIPFPSAFDKYCLIKKDHERISIKILSEEDLSNAKQNIEDLKNEKLNNKLIKRKVEAFKRMLDRGLISKEQFEQNVKEIKNPSIDLVKGIWYGIRRKV